MATGKFTNQNNMSTAISSTDELLENIRAGKKIPSDIDPAILEDLKLKAQTNEQIKKDVDNAITAGLMMIPGWGTIGAIAYKGASMLGNAIENKDEYGIASSEASAAFSDIFGVNAISRPVQKIKEDGFQMDDLTYAIPVLGGIKARKDAIASKTDAERTYSSEMNLAQQERSSDYYKNMYSQSLKDGGKVKGKGTSKSDSISTSLDPNSFVVPTENASIAMQLGKKYLGWDNSQKSDKGGESKVNLSDGEVVFQPDEVMALKGLGIDLNYLAPNAKGGSNFAEGGWVDEMAINILDSEGSRDTIYTDTKGHKTIGIGLMVQSKNGKRNPPAISALKSAGLSDSDINDLIAGKRKLSEEEIDKSYKAYLTDTLEPELENEFGEDWKQMDNKSKVIAADIMYNQGAANFKGSKWKTVRESLAKNDTEGAINAIKTEDGLKPWRETVKSRVDKLENISKGIIPGEREPRNNAEAVEQIKKRLEKNPEKADEILKQITDGSTQEELNEMFGGEKGYNDFVNFTKGLNKEKKDFKKKENVDETINPSDRNREEIKRTTFSNINEEGKIERRGISLSDINQTDDQMINLLLGDGYTDEQIRELYPFYRPRDIKYPEGYIHPEDESDWFGKNRRPESMDPKFNEPFPDLGLEFLSENVSEDKITAPSKSESENDKESRFNLGNVNWGTTLGIGQAAMGLWKLSQQGDRPEDKISPEFEAYMGGLRNAEPIGYTGEQYQTAINEIENIRMNDIGSIKELVGGDAGLAMASIMESGRRATQGKTKVAFDDATLMNQDRMSIRNQRANGEFFSENRRAQIIKSQMDEFDSNQAAYANLLNAGISNVIGSQDPLYKKYKKEYSNQ